MSKSPRPITKLPGNGGSYTLTKGRLKRQPLPSQADAKADEPTQDSAGSTGLKED